MKIRNYITYPVILLVLASVVIVSCGDDSTGPGNSGLYNYREPVQTNDGWQTATMSEAGLNTTPVIDLMEYLLEREEHHVNGIVIIKDGNLVFEEYFSGYDFDFENQTPGTNEFVYTYTDFDRNTLHYQASVTKSVTSVLLGIAIDKGFISGVDEKLFSFFPEFSDLINEEKNEISLYHALTMTSGYPWDDSTYPISDSRNDENQLYVHSNPLRFVLERDLSASPGTSFQYNSGTTVLLGEIIKRRSDMSLSEFAENYLFTPLGISTYHLSHCMNANTIAFAGGGLYLRPRDMAKIGSLFLQEGMWNNEQIISSGWINESTNSLISLSGINSAANMAIGYGYQWWIAAFTAGSLNGYYAAGWGGQFIIVLPEQNMVVVITQDDYNGEEDSMFTFIVNNYILQVLN